jgi:hypothetical protein
LTSLKKSDYPVSYFGKFDFGSFRIKPRNDLNLKIQGVLRHAKGLKSVKKPKAEAAKTRLYSSGFQSV